MLLICCLSITFSCKKACYNCHQYCAYCTAIADSSIVLKICANKSNETQRIDSFRRALQDTNYVCNLLKDDETVCDSKSAIKDGLSYYQKEDFYCEPK